MIKFHVIYCNDSGDVCFEECKDMNDVSEILDGISEMHGDLVFGNDIMEREVKIIRGDSYIPKPVTKVKLWE